MKEPEGSLPGWALIGLALACSGAAASTTAPEPPGVTIALVEARQLPLVVEVSAVLAPFVEAEVRARVEGFLTTQSHKDGEPVQKGQLLFSIDAALLETVVSSCRAELLRESGLLQYQRLKRTRLRQLGNEGVASLQELEDNQAAVQQAEAEVAAAEAALERASLELSYAQVRSPVTGIATIARVRPGNVVGRVEPTLLTTVLKVDPMRVNFSLTETEWQGLAGKLGRQQRSLPGLCASGTDSAASAEDRIELLLSDGSIYPCPAELQAIDPAVDPHTGTLQVQALVQNPLHALRAGQHVRVRVRQEDSAPSLVIPEQALISRSEAYSVAIVDEHDRVELRRVEVGLSRAPWRGVRSGVRLGERLVLDGLQKVKSGSVVRILPSPRAPLDRAVER